MENKRCLKQVKVLNKETFKTYKKIFEDELSTFEEYINVVLGSLFDNDYNTIEIIPITTTDMMIIYEIKN
jgi:hypothetical protein